MLTAGLRFAAAAGPTVPATSSLTRQDVEAVAAALPGVLAAGLTTALPRHSPAAIRVEVEPLLNERRTESRLAPMAEVSAGYFATLDAKTLAGRLFVPPIKRPVLRRSLS